MILELLLASFLFGTDSGSINEEENLFFAYANSGHLVNIGDKKYKCSQS